MGWRKVFATLLGLLAANVSIAGPFEMDVLETDELRLLYFDPFQTYLTPHVTRTYHNSLEFQKYIFDWTPSDNGRDTPSSVSTVVSIGKTGLRHFAYFARWSG